MLGRYIHDIISSPISSIYYQFSSVTKKKLMALISPPPSHRVWRQDKLGVKIETEKESKVEKPLQCCSADLCFACGLLPDEWVERYRTHICES